MYIKIFLYYKVVFIIKKGFFFIVFNILNRIVCYDKCQWVCDVELWDCYVISVVFFNIWLKDLLEFEFDFFFYRVGMVVDEGLYIEYFEIVGWR